MGDHAPILSLTDLLSEPRGRRIMSWLDTYAPTIP